MWQQPCPFQVQSWMKGCCDCSRCQWPKWPLPIWGFMSPLHCLFWSQCVLIHKSKFCWIICGLRWYMGWHRSIQVFVLLSIVSSVGNGSIRSAIFIHCFGCLNIENLVCNFKCLSGQLDSSVCAWHLPVVSASSQCRRGRGEYLPFIHAGTDQAYKATYDVSRW